MKVVNELMVNGLMGLDSSFRWNDKKRWNDGRGA